MSAESSPLVSIVIPAFNHARYLAAAIESLLAQTYRPVEIIVIDDGSTDDTPRVLADYATRVTVLSQLNAGQSATINRGWHCARGEVVSYLSADDRLLPQAVTTAVRALALHPDAVMVYGDYDLIGPGSELIRPVRTSEFDYDRMVRKLVCAPGPGVFIRRAAAERVGGWDHRFCVAPDFDFWLRLGLLGAFRRMPECLAQLRVHEGSTSFGIVDAERAEEPLRIIRDFFARPDVPSTVRAGEREALSSAYLLAARSHLRARRLTDGWKSIRHAARLRPSNVFTMHAARLVGNAMLNRPAHRILWTLRRTLTRNA